MIRMFTRITEDRLLQMNDREQRWLENTKKAFHDSDQDYRNGQPQDCCLQELCKAIDTAKTLRRSLRGEDVSPTQNKERFVEFLNLEMPKPEDGGFNVELADSRTGQKRAYSFAELVYYIRCMVHENENLNVSEKPNYHILIDWQMRDPTVFGYLHNGRLVCNGPLLWNRLREILAKFITGIDGMISHAKTGLFNITIDPPICSVKPNAYR
jgi:hypothetical protein